MHDLMNEHGTNALRKDEIARRKRLGLPLDGLIDKSTLSSGNAGGGGGAAGGKTGVRHQQATGGGGQSRCACLCLRVCVCAKFVMMFVTFMFIVASAERHMPNVR